ncbi:hypothetical protein ABW21_db0202534 [Orbilia brochopaga]|nr:hypothetical protein ABW21_db0202534 [Drechslerella brochopaga]
MRPLGPQPNKNKSSSPLTLSSSGAREFGRALHREQLRARRRTLSDAKRARILKLLERGESTETVALASAATDIPLSMSLVPSAQLQAATLADCKKRIQAQCQAWTRVSQTFNHRKSFVYADLKANKITEVQLERELARLNETLGAQKSAIVEKLSEIFLQTPDVEESSLAGLAAQLGSLSISCSIQASGEDSKSSDGFEAMMQGLQELSL